MKKITKIKTKYYSKEILKYLIFSGAVVVAASSPYFSLHLMRNISQLKKDVQNHQRRKKFIHSFYYLKRKGLIEIKKDGYDLRIVLTKEGKKRAGKYQINDLVIQKPKKWDKKWRVVIFDIPNSSRLIRDVFRGKLKEFGFYRLQQSIWVFPYPCKEEIVFLREFLGVGRGRIQILEVAKLEEDSFLKKHFRLQSY